MSSLSPSKATKEDFMSLTQKSCFIETCDNHIHKLFMCSRHYAKFQKLRSGKINSVIKSERHNKTKSREYSTYYSMRRRCLVPSDENYKYYGGRGIKICDRWLGKNGFVNFYKDMGDKPENLTLDRINVNGDYTPENCRWASRSVQAQNQRIRVTNTSGVKNLSYHKKSNKWVVRKTINGVRICIGYFSSRKDAEDALSKYEQ